MERTSEDSLTNGQPSHLAAAAGESAVLSKRDRRMMGRIAEFLGFADLMAVMMVAVTAFTAIATWRTASIATAIYRASERPYMGVANLSFNHDQAGDPRVMVEYKNFGSVAAEGVVMFRRMLIDGKVVRTQTRRKAAGILMPDSPHRLFLHLPPGAYSEIASGRSTLRIEVGAIYQGLTRTSSLCYLERFAYVPGEDVFEVDGGSPRCEELVDLRATADAVPAAQD